MSDFESYKSAFQSFMASPAHQSSGSDPEGGYLVTLEMIKDAAEKTDRILAWCLANGKNPFDMTDEEIKEAINNSGSALSP